MPRKKSPSKKSSTAELTDPNKLFFQSFIGEFVEVICRTDNMVLEGTSVPVTRIGFLLDIDDLHLYLSEDAQSVNCAVRREDYIAISIIPQMDLTDEAMRDVVIPENREDGN